MHKEGLVIVPAHNEVENIGTVIDKIINQNLDLDILVVDDGSVDDTAKVAEERGAGVISLPFNMGYGVALETGYKYAYEKRYKYVLQMDADSQHEPKNLSDLLNVVKSDEADIVIGSRFLGNCEYKTSFARKAGMVLFSKIVTFLSKQKITDPTSGFQAMNRNVLKFFTNGFYPSDYPDADVIILLNKNNFRIKEIPVIMYSNSSKKSMHRGLFNPLYYNFKMFLSILMIYLRKVS